MSLIIAKIAIIASFLIAVIIDVFLVTDNISGNTWSEIIQKWSKIHMIIPCGIGIICGHWFGSESIKMNNGIWIVLAIVALVGIIDIWFDVNPLWLFFIAVIVGLIW